MGDKCQAQALFPAVSRETWEDLQSYVDLLLKWQHHMNLISPTTIEHVWTRHIADSLQLFSLKPHALRWLDLGSGGGLPGIVTAICLKSQQAGHIDLVESNKKKASFLSMVVGQLNLPASVHAKRAQEVSGIIKNIDVVSARALTDLSSLMAMVLPWVQGQSVALLPKGRDFAQEIAQSQQKWQAEIIKHPSISSAESAILEVKSIHETVIKGIGQ